MIFGCLCPCLQFLGFCQLYWRSHLGSVSIFLSRHLFILHDYPQVSAVLECSGLPDEHVLRSGFDDTDGWLAQPLRENRHVPVTVCVAYLLDQSLPTSRAGPLLRTAHFRKAAALGLGIFALLWHFVDLQQVFALRRN